MKLKSNNLEIYKKAITIGLPVAFENMIYSLINFIDIFMVGKENILLDLGSKAVAGTGFANQIFTIFIVSLFGMNSGGGIFAAQYYGSEDFKNLKKCLGITLSVGFLFSMFFVLSGLLFPKEIMGIFTKDRNAIDIGARYFKIIIWTYPLSGIGFAFNMQLRAIGKTKYSFYSSVMSLIINAAFNYILIYGKLGFSAMGVEGAAVATVLARAVGTFYIIFMIYRLKLPIAGTFSELFSLSWNFIVKIMKVSLPVFAHEIMWVTGVSIYVIIIGRMGTEYAAAVQIVKSISNLIFVLLFGLASATSTIIGNEIGAGKEEEAYRTAVVLLKAGIALGITVAITFYAISPLVLQLMGVNKNLYPLTSQIFFSEMILIVAKSAGVLLIVGILRSGGDTLWTMFMDLIPLWFIAIPLTYIGGLILGLPISIVYFFTGIDELIKIIPCLKRLKSGKWINNLVKI